MALGYVPNRMKHAFPMASGWKKGPNPWPRGHEFYNIEGLIERKDWTVTRRYIY